MNFQTAKENAEFYSEVLDVRVFPIQGKRPFLEGSWKEYASKDVDDFGDAWKDASGYAILLEGYTVLDFDTKRIPDNFPPIEETFSVSTTRGYHFYFLGENSMRGYGLPEIDVKSGPGAYVVGPGSMSDTGVRYTVIYGGGVAGWGRQTEIQEALKRDSAGDPISVYDTTYTEGQRSQWLSRVAGVMRRRGVDEEGLIAILESYNSRFCSPPLEDDEVREIAHSYARYEPDHDDSKFMRKTALSLRERLVRPSELLNLPQPSWLIKDVFPKSPVVMLCGQPGSLKSFMALDLAKRLSDGLPLPGLGRPTEKIPVVYVAGEGMYGLPARIRSMDLGQSSMLFLPGRLDITDDETYMQLRELVEQDLQGGFMVLDTLSRISSIEDENSASEMNKVMGRLEDLAELGQGCTLLVLHHMTKTGASYRGSTAINASVSVMLEIKRDTLNAEKIRTEITSVKTRDFPDISYTTIFEVAGNSLRVEYYSLSGLNI